MELQPLDVGEDVEGTEEEIIAGDEEEEDEDCVDIDQSDSGNGGVVDLREIQRQPPPRGHDKERVAQVLLDMSKTTPNDLPVANEEQVVTSNGGGSSSRRRKFGDVDSYTCDLLKTLKMESCYFTQQKCSRTIAQDNEIFQPRLFPSFDPMQGKPYPVKSDPTTLTSKHRQVAKKKLNKILTTLARELQVHSGRDSFKLSDELVHNVISQAAPPSDNSATTPHDDVFLIGKVDCNSLNLDNLQQLGIAAQNLFETNGQVIDIGSTGIIKPYQLMGKHDMRSFKSSIGHSNSVVVPSASHISSSSTSSYNISSNTTHVSNDEVSSTSDRANTSNYALSLSNQHSLLKSTADLRPISRVSHVHPIRTIHSRPVGFTASEVNSESQQLKKIIIPSRNHPSIKTSVINSKSVLPQHVIAASSIESPSNAVLLKRTRYWIEDCLTDDTHPDVKWINKREGTFAVSLTEEMVREWGKYVAISKPTLLMFENFVENLTDISVEGANAISVFLKFTASTGPLNLSQYKRKRTTDFL